MLDIQVKTDQSEYATVTLLTPEALAWVSQNLTVYPDERIDANTIQIDGDVLDDVLVRMLKAPLKVKTDNHFLNLNENESLNFYL